jgi:hypothetical protein
VTVQCRSGCAARASRGRAYRIARAA